MFIVSDAIEHYLRELQPTRDAVQRAMEEQAQRDKFPIVGPLVGPLLQILAQSIGAKRVFEMGSGFGYSALWFLRGMPEGRIVLTDGSPAKLEQAKRYLGDAGSAERAQFELGVAQDILQRQDGLFDFIFCDIDKEQYPQVPQLAAPRLRRGGLLVVDNTLWSGKVTDANADDPATQGVKEFNRQMFARDDFVVSILPLRDGVMVASKK